MCNHLMYYCNKCGGIIFGDIDIFCEDYKNKKSCLDLTVVNYFHWLCLHCLRISFAADKLKNLKI